MRIQKVHTAHASAPLYFLLQSRGGPEGPSSDIREDASHLPMSTADHMYFSASVLSDPQPCCSRPAASTSPAIVQHYCAAKLQPNWGHLAVTAAHTLSQPVWSITGALVVWAAVPQASQSRLTNGFALQHQASILGEPCSLAGIGSVLGSCHANMPQPSLLLLH